MKMTITLALIMVVLGSCQAPASSTDPANGDPVLEAMRAELERSKSALKLEGMAAPYYIDYRVIDMDGYAAEASFGALVNHVRARLRFVRVVVRVGDYKQDSFFGQGEGSLEIMPVDNDVLSLRHAIWLATDKAYKAATEALSEKQAQLKQYTVDQPVDDFAHAQPVVSIGPLAALDFDPEPWLRTLRDGSALYKNDPQIESLGSSLRFSGVNRYFINSEGTTVRNGQTLYEMTISMSTQAADGMRLDRSHSFTANTIKELPSEQAFLDQTNILLGTLKQLREAPIVDDEYRGPVLFSGDAAATVISDLVGDNILGLRPDLGEPARTKGAYATSYQARILPDFLSVTDDPTLAEINGQPLLGKYDIDDEGVKAVPVKVVENGKLINYLIGRAPIRDFPVSNGHGRAKLPENHPGPSIGNLIVRSSEPFSDDALRKKLIEICQQRSLAFGYYVETFGPKLTPRLLYKVWAKDGRQELVRGGSFGELDQRSLRSDLIAAGDTVYVDNRTLNVPHSIVSPAILFDELEVKPANLNKDKLPEYPAPAVGMSK
jgi:hypothetical protein